MAESATATGVVAAAADATATTTTHSGNEGSKLVNYSSIVLTNTMNALIVLK